MQCGLRDLESLRWEQLPALHNLLWPLWRGDAGDSPAYSPVPSVVGEGALERAQPDTVTEVYCPSPTLCGELKRGLDKVVKNHLKSPRPVQEWLGWSSGSTANPRSLGSSRSVIWTLSTQSYRKPGLNSPGFIFYGWVGAELASVSSLPLTLNKTFTDSRYG